MSRMQLHWCSIDVERFLDLPLFAGVKRQIYHRLALGEVIPEEIERVVYLDMDVLGPPLYFRIVDDRVAWKPHRRRAGHGHSPRVLSSGAG